jgi:predicted small secreted protein
MDKLRIYLMITAVFFLGGCNQIDQLHKDVQAATEAVQKSADTIALAVPGERWQRILDKQFSGDPQKQKDARTEIENIFGPIVERDFEATLLFGFDPSKPGPTAAYFRTMYPDRQAVEEQCASRAINPFQAANVSTRPMTEAEVRARVATDVGRVINAIAGTPEASFRGGDDDGVVIQNFDSLAPAFNGTTIELARRLGPPASGFMGNPAIQLFMKRIADKKAQAATDLTNALLDPYSPAVLASNAAGKGTKTFPWHISDAKQWLVVLVSKADWDAMHANLKITAFVHEHDKPDALFENRDAYTFTADDFKGHEFHCDQEPGDWVWAIHDMTGQGISRDVAVRLQDVKKLLGDMKKL